MRLNTSRPYRMNIIPVIPQRTVGKVRFIQCAARNPYGVSHEPQVPTAGWRTDPTKLLRAKHFVANLASLSGCSVDGYIRDCKLSFFGLPARFVVDVQS